MRTQPLKETKVRLPKTQLWIGGKWIPSQSGRVFETINPATEEPLTSIAEGDEADINSAARAARRAFESGPWPKMRAKEREKILRRIADLIRENQEELALLETLDSGKPIESSRRIDIPAAAEAFDYYAGWSDKLAGETLAVDPEYFSYTLREPLGVIDAVTPLEFSALY